MNTLIGQSIIIIGLYLVSSSISSDLMVKEVVTISNGNSLMICDDKSDRFEVRIGNKPQNELYPGPTISPARPCRLFAGLGLVMIIMVMTFQIIPRRYER